VDPLFANMFNSAGKAFVGILAVAGGFLVGNVASLIVCRLLAKFAFRRSINANVEKFVRIVGGIAVAALIALILFRGGPGWGFGGAGDGEGEGQGLTDKASSSKERPKTEPRKSIQEPHEITKVRIEILAAKQYPKNFLFDGESEARDVAGAKQALRELRDRSGEKLQLVELTIYKDSTAESHQTIQEFIEYAKILKIGILTSKPDQKRPE
jgi:hypothetical protein